MQSDFNKTIQNIVGRNFLAKNLWDFFHLAQLKIECITIKINFNNRFI